jgi:Pyruvate/2-oxoacid:ferredoxin oxidoreductase delta subunit
MRSVRKIIRIDEELCNGCGECIGVCAEAALELVDGKAKLVAERYCDGLGACLGGCPTGALKIVEVEADEFDEAAVEELIAKKGGKPHPAPAPADVVEKPACACAGSGMMDFRKAETKDGARTAPLSGEASTLSQWPIQINLVPPHAPFLQNARLLVAADCAPAALPSFHGAFLPGRVLLIGCPKFDDMDGYFQRFVEIFQRNQIQDVTVLRMEVPCCGPLERLIAAAVQAAGKNVPVEAAVVSRQGEILSRGPVRATPAAGL